LSPYLAAAAYPERVGGTRRWRALAAVFALVVVTGCGDEGRDPDTAPSTSPASGEPTKDSSTGPTPTEWPTIDPPGDRTDPLQPADMLIFSPKRPLDADMVKRIEGLEGVQKVALFSMGQAVIENRAIDVAAVDPTTYRLFTPLATADSKETWDRVAGGELALDEELQKKLPITKDGYLKLGAAEDAPVAHIGAFASQGETTVEAVVNSAWVDELGLQEGNALLVSTGLTSPQSLRKPIERIVGDQASIQALDIVARAGLDPNATLSAYVVGSVADAVGVFNYTPIGGGRIAPEPAWVAAHIETRTMPIIGSMTCNKAIFPQLEAALREVVERGLSSALHPGEYAGCYYPRFIAGSTTLSNHSFGLAMDFNVPGNQRGTVGEMNRDVVTIFKKWGFAWGGDWGYTDPMHFEADRLVDPR
jgi:hypothetical protein